MAEITPDLMDSVLEEAAKIAEEVLAPLNAHGDAEGCVLENGVVRTPARLPRGICDLPRGRLDGDRERSRRTAARACRRASNKLVEEMICSANLAFSLYPGLTHGAYRAIESHGSEALQADLSAETGRWHLGRHHVPDRGALRHRSRPAAHPRRAAAATAAYRITGGKIFISAGEHDLTENIVHLVLARLPDAPPGVKGISMFLVPKYLPAADGRPGARNGVSCAAIEHKMGIKASATCQLNFDDATGWLVGEPHQGHARRCSR